VWHNYFLLIVLSNYCSSRETLTARVGMATMSTLVHSSHSHASFVL
jgi:hypothetical protein